MIVTIKTCHALAVRLVLIVGVATRDIFNSKLVSKIFKMPVEFRGKESIFIQGFSV